jgi:hypothetical protein
MLEKVDYSILNLNYADFNGTSIGTLYNDREAWIVPNSVQAVGDGTFVANTTPIGDVDDLLCKCTR